MAISKRTPDPEEPDLSTQSDFQLLNALTCLVSKENSSQLKLIAWEIMRRYTASLEEREPRKAKDYSAILGNARWGDAKRVYEIIGMKRGVLMDLEKKNLIESSSLRSGRKDNNSPPPARGKRYYDLISIIKLLESKDQDKASS